MAKCVRVVGQGVPVRMTDEEAFEVVQSYDGEYCSKSFWKRHWRTHSLPLAYSKNLTKGD